MKKRISLVSYLNTLPFKYGIEHSSLISDCEILAHVPAQCATLLQTKQADIGLIPVAAVSSLSDYHIVSNFCIGAKGKVNSVLLFSDCHIEDITHIYLDNESKTSVLLCQVLCQHYWNINPVFMQASPAYEKKISGTAAGLVIGDRALVLRNSFSYVYDLSEAWLKCFKLPFVFAVWVARNDIEALWLEKFNRALETGLQHIEESVKDVPLPISEKEAIAYLKNDIQYVLDTEKREAMQLFWNLIKSV